MCGIAGILSMNGAPVSLEELRSMCAAMTHRGPDEDGFYLDSGVGLGMRRLRIIDLETGRQPVRNEDGSIRVVFNGEIYNFKELRYELTRRGHSFYTATDTEAIVHLYEEHGPRCVEKMRGMFTFALWDARRRRLLVARDRLGIKPLYYGQIRGRLIFASELKAILQLPEVERKLNWRAVSHLFTCLCTSQSESIVEGVQKLPPGHLLIVSPESRVSVERYWDVKFEPDYDKKEEHFVERLRELLEESVRLHLVSDVPLGAFLSGGVDSSSVVAMAARLAGGPLKTFSIGFRVGNFNELPDARRVAEKFGTDHQELVLEPDVLSVIEDFAWYLDEPFGDSSAIPTYMVSKLASQHVTVVLSGDGGDELFAGYDRYVAEKIMRNFRFLPAAARSAIKWIRRQIPEGMRGRNFLYRISLPDAKRYLDTCTLFRKEDQIKLFRPEVSELLAEHDSWGVESQWLANANGDWLAALQKLDLNHYLPLDILTKVDRMSMAHSIEARPPLLDHKLVEFAATIPPELRLRGRTTKYIFKRAMRGILPDETIDKPKHGFVIPLGHWFRGQLGAFVRDLLLSETSRRRGIFDTGYIEKLLKWHERGLELDAQLWTLISFELWCRTFLDDVSRKAVENDRVSRPGIEPA